MWVWVCSALYLASSPPILGVAGIGSRDNIEQLIQKLLQRLELGREVIVLNHQRCARPRKGRAALPCIQ